MRNASNLEMLIFIPAMSHAAAKPFNIGWKPDSEDTSKTKLSATRHRQPTNFASSSYDTLTGSAKFFKTVHVI